MTIPHHPLRSQPARTPNAGAATTALDYRTQSLYEASYLLANGFRLVATNRAGLKTTLLFADIPELRQAVLDFYNGEGVVKAKPFVECYRSLKDMVFQR